LKKKIIFLTSTRADYGKLKSILVSINKSKLFDFFLLATGMHNLKFYGNTYLEIKKDKINNVFFLSNQKFGDSPEKVFSKSVQIFSDFLDKTKPDLVVVHGDRIEPLALTIVANLKNIKIAHIEGGEVSGTIDDSIRHSISKLSQIHFVTNQKAKKRLLQLGEKKNSIFIIGSPDVDLILSKNLPNLNIVKDYYNIKFQKYSIAILHPVHNNDPLVQKKNAKIFFRALVMTKKNYIVLYPNNDNGSKYILREINQLKKISSIKTLPSMRFEYFLTLLKNADFIIGNSSSGIMEAPYYGLPCINIGDRQNNRSLNSSQIDINFSLKQILKSICQVKKRNKKIMPFGNKNSSTKFIKILKNKKFWKIKKQKYFIDLK
jgi:UDP-N-acetylglucosamine 2-epimerase (hydrolysing)